LGAKILDTGYPPRTIQIRPGWIMISRDAENEMVGDFEKLYVEYRHDSWHDYWPAQISHRSPESFTPVLPL
jgi:hypothetical protein